MQTKEQRHTPQGTRCTGVIISDHWVATSEHCCENVAGAILDFNDDRGTGDSGSGSTGGPNVNFPCTGPCFGRKRRAALFGYRKSRNKRSTDDDNFDNDQCEEDDAHTDENCHRCGFCKKSGICLMRAHADILRRAEIHGIPAKKICLPKQPPIHGKQCWITGFDSVATRKPIELNMFNKGRVIKWTQNIVKLLKILIFPHCIFQQAILEKK